MAFFNLNFFFVIVIESTRIHILSIYNATSLNSLSCDSFFVGSSVFSIEIIILTEKNFIPLFRVYMHFFLLTIISRLRTFSTVMSTNGEHGHSYFVPDESEKASVFHH